MTRIELVQVPCALCGSITFGSVASGRDHEFHTSDDVFCFVRCSHCGHLYMNPRPSPGQWDKIYPQNYSPFVDAKPSLASLGRERWEAKKVRLLRRILGKGPKRILDVGCGSGRFLSVLRRFGSPDWELAGSDLDQQAVAECRKKGFEAYRESIEDLSFGKGSLDAVILLQVLEHVEDPVKTSEQVFSLLRSEGS